MKTALESPTGSFAMRSPKQPIFPECVGCLRRQNSNFTRQVNRKAAHVLAGRCTVYAPVAAL